jgi:hypothetical protein
MAQSSGASGIFVSSEVAARHNNNRAASNSVAISASLNCNAFRYNFAAEKREALDLWASHVARCAGNIIIARPVEAKGAETAGLSELEAV